MKKLIQHLFLTLLFSMFTMTIAGCGDEAPESIDDGGETETETNENESGETPDPDDDGSDDNKGSEEEGGEK